MLIKSKITWMLLVMIKSGQPEIFYVHMRVCFYSAFEMLGLNTKSH